MQRFGFLRRQGSGVGDAASGDAAPGDAAPGGGSPSTRSASRSDARGAANHHRADHDRDGEGTGGGSSDGGNSDDSRATTVIVKHGSRGSYGGGASGGLSGSDAFLDQWAGETAAGGPWGDRGHAARGGGGSGGGGGPPPPPLGTLKRVDSRTHVDEALHTIPGLRARGSIELPLTRRLAFRKCRGVARAASRRGVPFLVLLVIGLVAFAARGGGAGRGDGAFLSAAYARGGRRVGGNWEEAYDRRHRDEASSALGDDGYGGERVYDRSSDAEGTFVEDRRGRRLRAASGRGFPGADARAGRGGEAPWRTSGAGEASEGKRPALPRVNG